MGLSHSPGVVSNGLVFCTDMGNTVKSWKGKPTTNNIPNAAAFTGWSNYYRTLSTTSFITEFGTTGWRFLFQPSWSGLARGYTVPSTGTYTFSAYYRYLGGTASNNGGTVYISGWGGGDTAVAVNKNLVGVWQRVQLTLNVTNLSGTFYLISYGGTDSGGTSPDNTSFEVTMPQIEAGSFATPFVDGTRSNTQAIVDLTGKTTVSINDLTYNADGTFSFDGSNDYIDTGITATNLGIYDANYTFEAWVYPTDFANDRTIFGTSQLAFRQGLHLIFRNGQIYQGHYASDFGAGNGTLNAWNHICYTFVQSTGLATIYKNGVSQGSGTIGSFVGTTNILLGTWGGASYFLGNGAVYRIYNRVLSPTEIQQNFNALRGRFGV